MIFQKLYTSIVRFDLNPPFFHKKFSNLSTIPNSGAKFLHTPTRHKLTFQRLNSATPRFPSSNSKMGDATRPMAVQIPSVATADKDELLIALETSLGSSFNSEPWSPYPNPLIIVISGLSGAGKDAVINKLREVREGIHFVVTATSRAKRPGEADDKDYYFITKEEFLSLVERNELLEHSLVYGDYKGAKVTNLRLHGEGV